MVRTTAFDPRVVMCLCMCGMIRECFVVTIFNFFISINLYIKDFFVKMKNLFLQCTVPYNDIYNLPRQIIDNMVLSGVLYCLHITMATLKTGLIN